MKNLSEEAKFYKEKLRVIEDSEKLKATNMVVVPTDKTNSFKMISKDTESFTP